jgi:TPR repeat protein
MRRQDVQLLALARQGDLDALCEVGQRYLLGTQGFPLYTDLGLKYLSHPALSTSERSARIIAEGLSLGDLVRRDLATTLAAAASTGSAAACLKLGVWRALTQRNDELALELWERAASISSEAASIALSAYENAEGSRLLSALSTLVEQSDIATESTVAHALCEAARSADVALVIRILNFAIALPLERGAELCDAVCGALVFLQRNQVSLPELDSTTLHAILEDCVGRRNSEAALLLGRAFCGIDTAFALSTSLVPRRNLRGGTALLLRAADAGLSEAWLLLYRVHSDGQGSVANPQAALFFLEKAAASGNANAQRQLGAMILKSATGIAELELGLHWMSQAAGQDDAIAKSLLQSFVLPVRGTDDDALHVIEELEKIDPWVAHRLRVSRNFGLTKAEATCVDVVSGVRSWGLVVSSGAADRNQRTRFGRAIPALQDQFLESLRESAEFFRLAGEGPVLSNAEQRQRSQKLRYRLDRSGVDESMFFAQVPTATLTSLRQGSSWAQGVRQTLRTAIAN